MTTPALHALPPTRRRSRRPMPAFPPLVPGTVLDFAHADVWHPLFYGTPTPELIAAFGTYLRRASRVRDVRARLYHGTSAAHPILTQGLLPTSARRRRSLQSGAGFVYLSAYPGHAADFARFGYPGQATSVYQVDVPIRVLRPDRDQLRNQRHFAERIVGDTLAESLVFGHAACVKGAVPPAWIHDPASPTSSR